ncbi:hypothetical protein ACFX11_001821 [Malus domestica]
MDNAIVIKVMKWTGSYGQVTQVKVKFLLLCVGEWRGERKEMRHLEGRRLLWIEMPLQLPLPNPLGGWTNPLATSFDSIFGTSFLALPSPTFASVALGTWALAKQQSMQIAMEVQKWPSHQFKHRCYFDVLGLCCSSEVPLIENILKPLEGVKNVSVIVPSRTVIVVHDSLLISQLQNGDIYKKTWPSPHAIGSGVLLVLSFLKYAYRPLGWLALGAVAVGIFPVALKLFASIRNFRFHDINILVIIAGWTSPLATSFDSIFGTSFLALPSPTFASVALGTWALAKQQSMQPSSRACKLQWKCKVCV